MVVDACEREMEMKKQRFSVIAALAMWSFSLPATAAPRVATDQAIACSAYGFYYWSMIWDYSNGQRESATPGAINTDYWLRYSLTAYGEVHVAYMYDWATGRYVEAQAIRNVRL